MEDQTRSLSEVAGLMGVSERTVRRWIKAGRLKAYKPGRDYRIPEAGLRVFIEESEISPKDPAPLQLELEEQGGANTLVLGAEPHYNAFEAFGRILASSWKDELEEWDKKIPAETTPNLFDTGRLLEWVVGIGGTKRTYETIAVDTYDPPRTELQDTLRLMDEAYGEALQKCLKVLRPAKEYAEFRKIVEENDLEAILSNAAGDE